MHYSQLERPTETMMKEQAERLFPDGEYVTYDQIRQGDTIIRGGTTIYGTNNPNFMLINRAWHQVEYDTYTAWLESDPTVDPMCAEVAFTTHDTTSTQPWLYRVNHNLPLAPTDPTNSDWNHAILTIVQENAETRSTTHDEIRTGDFILNSITNPGRIMNQDDYFPLIAAAIVGEHEEGRGWILKDDPNGFCITLENELIPEANLIITL